MDSLRNQFLSMNIGYQKKIDGYENKIGKVFKDMGYLKNRIAFEKKKHAEFKKGSVAKISHLQHGNSALASENAARKSDSAKIAEVLNLKELKI